MWTVPYYMNRRGIVKPIGDPVLVTWTSDPGSNMLTWQSPKWSVRKSRLILGYLEMPSRDAVKYQMHEFPSAFIIDGWLSTFSFKLTCDTLYYDA